MLKDRVKELRVQKGLTQKQLALATNTAQNSIQKIESGETKNPRNIEMIAEVLGCTPEYLRFGTGGSEFNHQPLTPYIQWSELESYFDGHTVQERGFYCPIELDKDSNTIALPAPWFTMAEHFNIGEIAFIDLSANAEHGDLVLVHDVMQAKYFINILISESSGELLVTESEKNTDTALTVSSAIKVIGRVICTIRVKLGTNQVLNEG